MSSAASAVCHSARLLSHIPAGVGVPGATAASLVIVAHNGTTRQPSCRPSHISTTRRQALVIGTLQITLHVPDSHSLKDKRMVVRSITSRVRQTFAVAVAEVGEQDTWQTAVVGVACVSNDARHADEMCQKVLAFVENNADGLVSGSRFELIHV
jgi:uncharacterized protein YlxP (DUF503 family)